MSKRRHIVFTLRRNIRFWYDKERTSRDDGFSWVGSRYSRNELVTYLVRSKNYDYPVLEHLSKDMSEKKLEYNFSSKYGTYIPLYYIAKEVGERIIRFDVSTLAKDMEKKEKEISKHKKRVSKEYAHTRKLRDSYTFRKDPVYGVHKRRYHRGEFYRHCRIHRNATIEAMFKVEYTELMDASYRRINLPAWDEKIRHNDKSWKTSYKVKKQWMKHKNKHKDTWTFDKRQYMNEMCEEERNLEI